MKCNSQVYLTLIYFAFQTNLGIPLKTKAILEGANFLHDEIANVVWYSVKNPDIFTIHFFHRCDESNVLSQFWPFEEKVHFISRIFISDEEQNHKYQYTT